MKVIEVLKIGRNILELLHKSCISIKDIQYVALYDEYMEIVRSGGKSTYAAAHLSRKYKISERKVYYLVKKFGGDCKTGAV